MVSRLRRFALLLAVVAVPLVAGGTAPAAIGPPWCGTPEPDAAGALPDGSSPSHPMGSFPHIPYYAIKCTRVPLSGFFAAGLWRPSTDPQSVSAPGSLLIAHGPNAANTARITVFANNPLYRSDPEREWPAVNQAAYRGDQ